MIPKPYVGASKVVVIAAVLSSDFGLPAGFKPPRRLGPLPGGFCRRCGGRSQRFHEDPDACTCWREAERR